MFALQPQDAATSYNHRCSVSTFWIMITLFNYSLLWFVLEIFLILHFKSCDAGRGWTVTRRPSLWLEALDTSYCSVPSYEMWVAFIFYAINYPFWWNLCNERFLFTPYIPRFLRRIYPLDYTWFLILSQGGDLKPSILFRGKGICLCYSTGGSLVYPRKIASHYLFSTHVYNPYTDGKGQFFWVLVMVFTSPFWVSFHYGSH